MKPQRRHVDRLTFRAGRNRVIPQPLGVVGVLVPWNFPINLSLVPLTYIFAAGNRAMVKMSENSRHLARLLIDRMPSYFAAREAAVLRRDRRRRHRVLETALRPPAVHRLGHHRPRGDGRGGENLCPVTLELGGKAPAIVCDDFPLRLAAERILFIKYLNAGPDLHHGRPCLAARSDKSRPSCRRAGHRAARYASLESTDYTSSSTARLRAPAEALEEARARAARA
jgi:coniferyl-aldehyde dehydrogenase